MKPAKKNKPGTTKKNESKEELIKKIPNYFQTAVKPVIGGTINEFKNTKPIYVELLKTTLKDRDAASNVIPNENGTELVVIEQDNTQRDAEVIHSFDIDGDGRIVDESSQCSQCSEKDKKYNDLMKLYLKSLHRYSELDFKHKDLLQAKTHLGKPESPDTVTTSSSHDIFTPNEVKYLEAMPLDKSADSTFVLKCLEFAYKNDTSVLRNKTLMGTQESVVFVDGEAMTQAKKDPLTPIKVQRIKGLFMERLSKCQIDSTVFGQRIKDSNVNKLFATGILNISKKKKQ